MTKHAHSESGTSPEASKELFVKKMACVRTAMRDAIMAIVEEVSRGPHATEVLEHALALQSGMTALEFEALVCAILRLDWDAYGAARLQAQQIGEALGRSDDAIFYIASSHQKQIACHPLGPYLNLDPYWKAFVEEHLEGADWRGAWERILQASTGFPPPDTRSGPHHGATPALLAECVNGLVEQMEGGAMIDALASTHAPSPLGSPASQLFFKLGGAPVERWNPTHRRKIAGVPSQAARRVSALSAYFNPPEFSSPASRRPRSSGRGRRGE